MVSPINTGTPIKGALNAAQDASSEVRADSVNRSPSPALNIPNDGENYHWFLPEITGSRTTITATIDGNHRIRAEMGVNDIVDHILGHVGV